VGSAEIDAFMQIFKEKAEQANEGGGRGGGGEGEGEGRGEGQGGEESVVSVSLILVSDTIVHFHR